MKFWYGMFCVIGIILSITGCAKTATGNPAWLILFLIGWTLYAFSSGMLIAKNNDEDDEKHCDTCQCDQRKHCDTCSCHKNNQNPR